MKSSRFKKISIIALGVTVLLFLAVLIATPYIMDLTLERWLVSRGPEVGKVKNIDFNPFSGRLSMDGLIVETRGGRTLSISHASLLFSWRQLFKKQLYLKELVLHDAFLLVDRLDESGFRMGGLILNELKGPEKKSDKPGWEVGIASFVLQNAQIAYDTPELEATYYIDQYTLTGLETWNKQKPVQMAYKGRINESRIDVRATVNVLHATKTWKGSIALEDGSLALISKVRGLQQYEPAGSIDIDMQLDARMQEDGSVNFASEGAIVFRDLQLKYEDFAVQQDKIAWQGRMAGNKSAGQQFAGTVEGQLAGAGFALDNQADSMQFLLGMFDWQGKAGVTPQGDSLALTMESELAGEDLHANDEKNKVSLLGLEKFNVSGIQVAGLEDIQVSQAVLQNFRLVEKESIADKNAKGQVPPLLQTAKVEISDARMQNRTDIFIDSINFDDVAALVHRSKEGSWQIMPAQHESPEKIREQPDPEIADQGAETGPIRFTINSLQASGRNSIRFEDESLHRPFRMLLHIDELKLNTVGTADTAEPARFAIKGRLGDYGAIALSGTVNPGQKPIFLDMKGTLAALDMPPFSSYTGRTIGYNVTSGQLDTDYTVKIDKGMMDAIFDLHMRNLEVARVDPESTAEIDSRMDVPLESALAMLRNKKDVINFKLELKDDINNPKFGIQDAINQALAKAMKFATLSYLKYTLQPFGTYIAIAEVVGKAGKEMSKVGLDPVTFPAAEIVLDDKAGKYLGKVTELLNNRPKLRLELCGRAGEKDRAALVEKRLAVQKRAGETGTVKKEAAAAGITVSDDVLLDFARERAKLVKESLVSQHGIDHERIFLCLPEIDKAPDTDARVELFLD